MSKDRFERKAYRRSPGRQYGYDYDPLQNGRADASLPGDRRSSNGEDASRSSGPLAPRPDPRRTRQLLRQSIIASKYRPTTLNDEEVEQEQGYDELDPRAHQYTNEDDYDDYEEREDSTLYGNRLRARNGGTPLADARRSPQAPAPVSQQYSETRE